VINTAINKYFYTVLTERSDSVLQVISSDLRAMRNIEDLDLMSPQAEDLEIPLQVLKEFNCRRGANLFLASEIPPGTGLGSSASVCVNMIKAVTTWLGIPMSKHQLAEQAFTIAADRLGRPVGKQDEYAAAFGGLNHLTFGSGTVHVESLALAGSELERLERRLMLFFTGSARDSADILADQRDASATGQAQVVKALGGIKDLVAPTRRALESRDFDVFGRLLHEAWLLKKRISSKISTAHVDRLYELARAAGAMGGKIAGAGGGGFLMLYCREEHQPAVRAALETAHVREMHFKFDLHGATVVYDDPFFDSSGRGVTRWRFVPSGSGDASICGGGVA
jgi:D-glycero-alpha-D-manno-heptose-7-phosphate kinase